MPHQDRERPPLRTARRRRLLTLTLLAPCLAAAASSLAAERAPDGAVARALRAPATVAPADGAAVEAVPAFSWRRVRGAAKYEFQFSADSGFRSTLASFETQNTSASIDKTLFDGAYYWRVRAMDADGKAGRWSRIRSIRKLWASAPQPLAPDPDASITYPTVPLVLRWSPAPHAVKYEVAISTDPTLAGNLVTEAGRPLEVGGTSLALTRALGPGRYYWAVTPRDAGGLKGRRSSVRSFVWSWPSATIARVTDLNADARVYDPQFSWDAVPGAARYEVEVNPSQDFAPGSKVCCADLTTGTSLSPTKLFPNNTYYWRMRAFDLDGNAGVWNTGPGFQKDFDGVVPSIPNLRLRDNVSDPATSTTTSSPVVAWDPVPGATSYEVQVAPYEGGGCSWSKSPLFDSERWDTETASTAWAPLGALPIGFSIPGRGGPSLQQDLRKGLEPGRSYCARVRARAGTDTQNQRVVSDWTQLGGLGNWGFTYSDPNVAPSSGPLIMPAGNYRLPTPGSLTPRMPLFTWDPVPGACQYFVVVALDAAFTEVVDRALTRQPTYAPRLRTYPDETTSYYWAVMPVNGSPCGYVATDEQQNHPKAFEKRSTPPVQLAPANGAEMSDQPTFRWTAVEAAREYRLQVAADPSFGNLIDDVRTAATAYTSSSTYPADTEIYWRVRANDENGHGLTWSSTGTFRRGLRIPVPSADNPTRGEIFPVFSWAPVQGAVSYGVHVEEPDGDQGDYTFRSNAAGFIKLQGLGAFRVQVRAHFPKAAGGTVPGGYAGPQTFTRFIDPPSGARLTSDSSRVLLTWDPSPAATRYRVEFSETNSFTRTLDTHTTENTNYAPRMNQRGFQDGGLLYWRVAALDEGNNAGGYAIGSLRLPRGMRITLSGLLQRRKRGKVAVTVTTAKGRPIRRARVKVKGAGVRSRPKRTGKRGTVRLRLRPRRRGSVIFTVSKRGYRAGKASVAVR